jgi:hypothetical protein
LYSFQFFILLWSSHQILEVEPASFNNYASQYTDGWNPSFSNRRLWTRSRDTVLTFIVSLKKSVLHILRPCKGQLLNYRIYHSLVSSCCTLVFFFFNINFFKMLLMYFLIYYKFKILCTLNNIF